jgi:Stress responsive A/B Barrel Domain
VIQHIVLLKLKPGTSDEQVAAAFEAGGNLPDEIPGVLNFTYGRDRSEPAHGFSVASVVQLKDAAALETYLDHPRRVEYLERHVDPITDDRIEIDVPLEATHMPSIATWYWGTGAPPD